MKQPLNREHYGPEPDSNPSGKGMVHKLIHERAIGKTIARVYLGDCEPLPDLPQSEYLLLEFTDGTALLIEVASGYSFWVGLDDEVQKLKRLIKHKKDVHP